MFRDLVDSLLSYQLDPEHTLSLHAIEILSSEIQRDVTSAFESSGPLIEMHPRLYAESSSFLDFLFRIVNVPDPERLRSHRTDELETLRAVLAERDSKLDRLQSQFVERGRELERLKTRLAGCEGQTLRDELKTLRSQLDEQGCELVTLRSQLDERDCELETLQSHFAMQNNELEILQGQFDVRGNELGTLQGQFDVRGNEFETLKGRFDMRGNELETLRSQFDMRGHELETLRSQFDVRGNELETLRSSFAKHEEQTLCGETLRSQFDVRGNELETLRSQFDMRGNGLETLRSQFDVRGNELETLRSQFDVRGKELETLRSQFDVRGKELETLRSQFDVQDCKEQTLRNAALLSPFDERGCELKTLRDELEQSWSRIEDAEGIQALGSDTSLQFDDSDTALTWDSFKDTMFLGSPVRNHKHPVWQQLIWQEEETPMQEDAMWDEQEEKERQQQEDEKREEEKRELIRQLEESRRVEFELRQRLTEMDTERVHDRNFIESARNLFDAWDLAPCHDESWERCFLRHVDDLEDARESVRRCPDPEPRPHYDEEELFSALTECMDREKVCLRELNRLRNECDTHEQEIRDMSSRLVPHNALTGDSKQPLTDTGLYDLFCQLYTSFFQLKYELLFGKMAVNLEEYGLRLHERLTALDETLDTHFQSQLYLRALSVFVKGDVLILENLKEKAFLEPPAYKDDYLEHCMLHTESQIHELHKATCHRQ